MSEEPGWYPDPYFMGRERYWDGREWTEQCRSAETKEPQPSIKPRPPKNPVEATPSATAAKAAARSAVAGGAVASPPRPKADATPAPPASTPTPDAAPVPAPSREAAAVAGAAAAATSATTDMGAADERPTARAEAPVAAPAEPPAAPAAVPDATEEGPAVATIENATTPTEPVDAELAGSEQGDHDEPAAAGAGNQEPPSRGRRRTLIGALAAAVIVVAAVSVAELTKKSATPLAVGPVVAQAASATLNQKYAAVDMGVKVQSGDKATASTVSGFSGNGTFDLASSLGALTLNGPGNAGSELMVLDNETIYIDPGGLVGRLVKNKVWVSATADDLGATSPSGFAVAPTLFQQLVGSPTTLLQQLQAKGVTATAVRASIYQGTPVEEYNVTLSPQAINVRLQGLPASLQGDVLTAHAPEHVFLTTNGLVRAISVPITVEDNGARATGHVVVGFTSWGVVADIVAPPADQVVSWAQFKAVITYTSHLG